MRHNQNNKKLWILSCLLLLVLMVAGTVYRTPVQAASSSYEEYVAKTNFQQLNKEYRITRLPDNSRYMRIFNRVERAADSQGLNFKLYYIDSPVINALYIGDGMVMVFRGLLDLLETDDQIAAVYAHELGHGVKGHIEKQLQTALGLQFLGWIFNQITDQEYDTLANFAADLLNKGYSRDQEKEADLYAVQLINRAGYNPLGVLELMRVLWKASGRVDSDLIEIFQTHPNPSTRIGYISEYLEQKMGIEVGEEYSRPPVPDRPTPQPHNPHPPGPPIPPDDGPPVLTGEIEGERIIFADSFNTSGSGWSTDSYSISERRYRENSYEIEVKRRKTVSWSEAPVSDFGTRYTVEVDIELWQGRGDLGFIFNLIDTDNYYTFRVDPVNRTYLIERVNNDHRFKLVNWTRSTSILRGSNHLRLTRNGAMCRFYVNGRLLTRVSVVGRGRNREEKLGLLTGAGEYAPVTGRFDTFVLYRN